VQYTPHLLPGIPELNRKKERKKAKKKERKKERMSE